MNKDIKGKWIPQGLKLSQSIQALQEKLPQWRKKIMIESSFVKNVKTFIHWYFVKAVNNTYARTAINESIIRELDRSMYELIKTQ